MAEPIFINGRFLTQPVSGVQRYGREVLRALDGLPDAKDFVVLAPKGAASPDLKAIRFSQIGAGAGHPWEQTHLYRAARRGRLLSLTGSGPFLHPHQVVVVHDAAVFRHAEHFDPAYAFWHRTVGRVLGRRARLATVSAFSRRELAEVLRLSSDVIAVAPNAADHMTTVTPDPAVLNRLDLGARPYVVAIGNLTPNKNLGLIVQALALLPDLDVQVVIVGGAVERVFGRTPVLSDRRIIPAGRLSDAETAALLDQARALIFPSRYEGFGLPPLEAMARDCPVIASDIPAAREVCGDAAAYFDPSDASALARLMAAAVVGRRPSSALHRARVATYGWARSAATLDRLIRTAS